MFLDELFFIYIDVLLLVGGHSLCLNFESTEVSLIIVEAFRLLVTFS